MIKLEKEQLIELVSNKELPPLTVHFLADWVEKNDPDFSKWLIHEAIVLELGEL